MQCDTNGHRAHLIFKLQSLFCKLNMRVSLFLLCLYENRGYASGLSCHSSQPLNTFSLVTLRDFHANLLLRFPRLRGKSSSQFFLLLAGFSEDPACPHHHHQWLESRGYLLSNTSSPCSLYGYVIVMELNRKSVLHLSCAHGIKVNTLSNGVFPDQRINIRI